MAKTRYIEIEENDVGMSLSLKTKYGKIRVDIEMGEHVEKDGAFISYFPDGADGDGFDIAGAKVNDNGDINVLTFGNVYNEDPSNECTITREDVDKAFYINAHQNDPYDEKEGNDG